MPCTSACTTRRWERTPCCGHPRWRSGTADRARPVLRARRQRRIARPVLRRRRPAFRIAAARRPCRAELPLTCDVQGCAARRSDDEQLFYLQARGIPEDQARRLIVRGFVGEIIQKITVPAVRERLTAAIEHELELTETLQGTHE